MNSTRKTILAGLFIFLIFLIALNIYLSIPVNKTEGKISNSVSGEITKISLSDSVSVQVIKNRWYGKIIVEDGAESIYLLNILEIPLKSKGLNLILVYVFSLVIGIEILILLNRKWRKNEKMDKIPIDSTG